MAKPLIINFKPCLFLIFSSTILFFAPNLSMAKNVCGEILAQVNQSIANGFVSDDTRQQFHAVYTDSALSPIEKHQKSLELYIESRFALLTERDANAVREILRTYQSKDSETANPKGFFLWPNRFETGVIDFGGTIHVEVPTVYRNSPLEGLIFAHELEHAIQFIARRKNGTRALARLFRNGQWHFKEVSISQEEGAFRAEWEYVNAIPEWVLQEVVGKIRSDSNLSNESKKMWLASLLKDPDVSVENHVAMIRRIRNYSDENLAKQASRHRALVIDAIAFKVWAFGIFPPMMAHVLASRWCVKKLNDPSFDRTRSQFFSTVCLKIGRVTEMMNRMGVQD